MIKILVKYCYDIKKEFDEEKTGDFTVVLFVFSLLLSLVIGYFLDVVLDVSFLLWIPAMFISFGQFFISSSWLRAYFDPKILKFFKNISNEFKELEKSEKSFNEEKIGGSSNFESKTFNEIDNSFKYCPHVKKLMMNESMNCLNIYLKDGLVIKIRSFLNERLIFEAKKD